MLKETKDKLKIGAASASGAGIIGLIGGAGLDHILAEKAIDSLKAGDIKGAIAFVAIFLLIWLKLKGVIAEIKEVRLALTSPEAPIALAFAKGDKRMTDIENKHLHDQKITEDILEDHGERLVALEQFIKPSQGGTYGQSDHIT